ncbi:MAG: sugar phosphate isomerase/epimerase [Nitrospira sp.]|nr:sugar phosphate isomerase/epimerase [Nitrospira sp.]
MPNVQDRMAAYGVRRTAPWQESDLLLWMPAMNRRDFLHAASLALVAASPVARALDANNEYRRNIGLQLYTLRNELSSDTPGTIKAIAKAGYKQAEMFGFPDCDPVIAACRESGLALNSTHFQWDSVVNPKDDSYSDFQRIIEKANKIGLKHLVIPYLTDQQRKNLDDYKKVAAHANKAAALAKKAGIQLSYHNHAFEFQPREGGRTGFEIFMKEFSPEVQFELDVFWVKVGGVEPVSLMQKLSGRVSQLHLKDLKDGLKLPEFGSVPNDAFQELGDGIIPMEPIIEAGKAIGVKHCHVEQDQSPNPLESVRQSLTYLQRL